jgi:hypothetical protein
VTIEVNDDVGRFIVEVLGERESQDNQWGGPAHDDAHSHKDWFRFINRYTAGYGGDFESRMKKIAALALAAVESNRRKNYGATIAGN